MVAAEKHAFPPLSGKSKHGLIPTFPGCFAVFFFGAAIGQAKVCVSGYVAQERSEKVYGDE
jgi:hypothetical protein